MQVFLKILLLAVLVIIFAFLFFNLQSQVCFKNNCFNVELARTQAERETGLMNRKKLGKNSGMLFIFDTEGIYPFWMKNTLIPLDMVWIDANKKVVFIKENAEPCQGSVCPSISPDAKAKYVLEINAGIVKNTGLKIGDLVEIPPSL